METRSSPASTFLLLLLLLHPLSTAVEILSKSRVERCTKTSDSDKLDCNNKIVVDLAVPSGSSGGEASIVAQLVEVEQRENATRKMHTLREPPVITINKSAAYALYKLIYLRDVAYKPEEFHVETRRCEPDAPYEILGECQGLRDQNGNIIENTQPVCCPCGPEGRYPTTCGSIFQVFKGKTNTAHCLKFPGDWFHVFAIGKRSLGFSVRVEVRKGSSQSEAIVGPDNRAVLSEDNFLRVNLIGDFVGYTSIPSFEDFYLVTPRLGAAGQPTDLGGDYSKWMLLERERFTLDGLECNKIGVSYDAYRSQPNFCSSPLWSCLHNQLWHFWEADQNQIRRNQPPEYVVEGRFKRINQHPNAGTHSFSMGITEALNTNLLIELRADDIDYVYQRSPGKVLAINIPTFEALTQFGTATVTTKNTGKLEASYSLTFRCRSGVSYLEEQFYIMKPEEEVSRSFRLYLTSDLAATYECAAILKASDFSEVDRADCQFTTTATILDDGSQIVPANELKEKGINGIFKSIKSIWGNIWEGLLEFFSGKTCRSKCSSFFNFRCHMQYICMSWILLLSLLLAVFPTGVVLLWLLHQQGLFDPIYDWWYDRYGEGFQRSSSLFSLRDSRSARHRGDNNARLRDRKHSFYEEKKRKRSHTSRMLHERSHSEIAAGDHYHHRHESHLHVHKERHKYKHSKDLDEHHGHKSSKR
uniref:Generative cell specific-1 n=1 Tax=Lilium longiflorum TaxID=4690 RepID=Q2PGG7_LILLO|nr:generative cell specific-1 [Lilium longiflorum]